MQKWMDKYDILDSDHVNTLETMAAINEFSHKMPRSEAEGAAYQQYMQERLVECAAHHLAGMRAALGAGDDKSAAKHGKIYHACLEQLGYPAVGPIPDAIAAKLKHETPKVYNFRGHDADSWALPLEKSNNLHKELARLIVARLQD